MNTLKICQEVKKEDFLWLLLSQADQRLSSLMSRHLEWTHQPEDTSGSCLRPIKMTASSSSLLISWMRLTIWEIE
jgi:hypothetical protein